MPLSDNTIAQFYDESQYTRIETTGGLYRNLCHSPGRAPQAVPKPQPEGI
jgi:hypothetical protein